MTKTPSLVGLKRLLVATDFSPRADIALKRAAQLVNEHGGTLTLFHVRDAPPEDMVAQQLTLGRRGNTASEDPSAERPVR